MTGPSTEEIRDRWDAAAQSFAATFEPSTAGLAAMLQAQLQLTTATAYLEVGAGAGLAARLALQWLPDQARVVVTDIAPAMVSLSRQRLPARVEVCEADAQALSFPDATFDRYAANLNLMLVPDPDRALAEAARVLSPGGLAGFTVWGRPERSPVFELVKQAADQVGVELPQPPRTNYHLGDREALIARMQAAGLDRVVAFYAPMPFPMPDGPTYAEIMLHRSPNMAGFMEALGPKAAELERALASLGQACLDEHRPLSLDALVVVGRRPDAGGPVR